ncbi:MAG: hypothetical protein ACYC6F_08685 [Longimicrobiales bacterium]
MTQASLRPSQATAGEAHVPRTQEVGTCPVCGRWDAAADTLGVRAFQAHSFAWDAPRHPVVPWLAGLRPLPQGTALEVRGAPTFTRWTTDHAMQSAVYRREEGLQDDVSGFWRCVFVRLARVLVALGGVPGEEILLHPEVRA